MEDITSTGALSFIDLKLANDEAFQKALNARVEELNSQYRSIAGSKEFSPEENDDQAVRSSLYGTSTPWGQSMFDEDTAASANEFELLQDIRANNQSWYAKLGAGLAKGVGLAGTTFLDGTVGLIYGVSQMKDKGFSALWDNEISNGLLAFNRAMEDFLPNYRTMEEQEGPWYNNLGTVNFWADGFLKNLGFTVGALYSGSVFTKGLLLGGKALLALGKLGKAVKPVEALGVAMQLNGLGAKLTGSLFSAINEGRIEANNTVYDVRELRMQELLDAYIKRKSEIDKMPIERQAAALEELNNNYNIALNLLDEDLKKIGLTDLLINIPILTFDNFFTFGKMYSQGFKNAKNVATSNVKKSKPSISEVSRAANEAADATEDAIQQGIKKLGTHYDWDTITKKRAVGKGLLTSLREGNEEMAQAWASEFAGNWFGYKDDVDTYYRAMTDPKALLETLDAWAAASAAFANTYGNMDRYEEFAIGALTGLLGSPTFGSRLNASANTWAGRNKMIGISGGIFAELKMANEMNRLGLQHVEAMNRIVDKVEHHKGILAASKKFTDAMDGWVEENDKFEFKNSEDNEDWNGISSFMSTGRKNDLLALVDLDFENASDEELAAIAAFTTPLGSKVMSGGWKDANGDTITADSSTNDKAAMRKKLSDKRDEIKKKIEDYEKSLSYVRNLVAGSNNVSESEVLELAWLHWKTNRFGERFNQVVEDNAEMFRIIDSGFADLESQLEEEDSKTIQHETGNMDRRQHAAAVAANKLIELGKKELLKLINSIKSIRNFFHNVLSSKGARKIGAGMAINSYKEVLDSFKDDTDFYNSAIAREDVTYEDYKKAFQDLRDLGRLSQAFMDFNKRLSDFAKDPQKIKNNRKKIDQLNAQRQQNIEESSRRTNARNNASDRTSLKGVEDNELQDMLNSLDSNNPNDEELRNNILDELGKRKTFKLVKRNLLRALDEAEENEDTETYNTILAALDRVEQANAESDTLGEFSDLDNEVWHPEGIEDSDDDIFDIITLGFDEAISDMEQSDNMLADDKGVDKDENGEVKTPAEKVTGSSNPTGHDSVDSTPAVNSEPRKVNTDNANNTNNQLQLNKKDNKQDNKQDNKKNNNQDNKQEFEDIKVLALLTVKTLDIEDAYYSDRSLLKAVIDFASRVYTQCQNSKDREETIKALLDEDEWRNFRDLVKNQGVKNPHYIVGYAVDYVLDLFNTDSLEDSGNTEDNKNYNDEVGPPTTIPNFEVDDRSYDEDHLYPHQQVLGTWFPLITEYPKNSRSTIPYYKTPEFSTRLKEKLVKKGLSGQALLDAINAETKRLGAVYDYLKDHNAFLYGSKLKKGDKISFVIDPELNEKAGEIVILMLDKNGHIVGSLKGANEETYTDQSGLSDFISKTLEEYQLAVVNGFTGRWTSSKTTTVNQTMVGKVLFSNEEHNLNLIFTTGSLENSGVASFTLGIYMPDGSMVLTSRAKRSSRTSDEARVRNPFRGAQSGLPFLIIPTGEGTNKLVSVPVKMNLYSPDMKGLKFDLWVVETITAVFNSKGFDITTATSQRKLKDALSELFIIYGGSDKGGFFVTILDGKLKISVTMLNGKSVNKYISDPNKVTVEGIVEALRNAGLGIQVNRKYINDTIVLSGREVKYNEVLGEIMRTNMPVGIHHTVNDWFTINPIDKDGKQQKAERIKSVPKDESRSGERKTWVNVGGKTYIYKSNGDITDAAGNKLKLIDRILENKIKAAADILERALRCIDIYNPNVYDTQYGLYDTKKSLFIDRDDLKKAPNTPVLSGNNQPSSRPSILSEDNLPLGKITAPEIDGSSKPLNKVQENFLVDKLRLVFSISNSTDSDIYNAIISDAFEAIVPESVLNRLYELGEAIKKGDITIDLAINYILKHLIQRQLDSTLSIIERVSDNNLQAPIDDSVDDSIDDLQIPEKDENEVITKKMTFKSSSKTDNDLVLTLTTPAKSESKTIVIPKCFNTSKLKNMWNALTPELQSRFTNIVPMALRQTMQKLERIWKAGKFNGDVDSLFPKNSKYRRVLEELQSREELIEKELEWARKALPQLSEEDRVRLIDGIIKVSNSENPSYAWGKFQDGIITISRTAARGTVYHEAFHFVTGTLLSNEELEALYTEASAKYNMDNLDDVEEELAEDFRKYMQTEETPFFGKIVKIFRTIKHSIQTILGNESMINNMFYRISRGKLAGRISREYKGSRYQEILYTEEEKNILKNAPRDSQGNLLAPNGKPSNLTERQYAQVRTKAFKEWFGDWENNPSEASKVVDKNGEPLVVHHASRGKHTIFDRSFIGKNLESYFGKGFYFTSSIDYALDIPNADTIRDMFLNIRNPIIVTELDDASKGRAQQLGVTNFNNDGAIVGYGEIDWDEFVVLNSNLIKSATDNIGTFSTTNNDIRYKNTEATEAQRIFFNEVYGRKLSDYDIVRINKKLKKLSESAGDSWTWHLLESSKDRYYVAGYRNRPIIPGLYSSPSFRFAPLYRKLSPKASETITKRNPLSYSKLPLSRRSLLRDLGVSELAYEKMTEYEKREFWRCKM